jgi:hypothetical protein
MSKTPRTDASYVCHYGDGLGQWVPREFACELERELFAQKEQMRVLEDEMLVLGDERNAAVLDAKENMDIANEFKHLMEEYRQREADANEALRVAVGLLSTMPQFSNMHPNDVLECVLKTKYILKETRDMR